MTDIRVDGGRAAARRQMLVRKRIGLALIALPLTLFMVLAVGEAATLEPGWWSHVLQVVAVAALAAVAWFVPRVGGPLLIVAGVAFGALLLVAVADDLWSRLVTVALLFAPLVAGGVFFSLAGSAAPSGPARRPGR